MPNNRYTAADKKKFPFRLRFMSLVRRFRSASVLIIAENACFICRGNGVNEELLISK